jgi:hypothetical protein
VRTRCPPSPTTWKGAVDYLLKFAEVTGSVDIIARAPGTHEVRLLVRWTA